MNTKKILLGCAIGCVGLMVIGGVGGYLAYRLWVKPQFSGLIGDKDIGPAAVVTGEGVLQSRVLLEAPEVGQVTDIALGKLDPRPGAALVVAGEQGASSYTRDGRPVSSWAFPEEQDHVEIVDVEGDGTCEFWERGEFSDGPALFSHEGKLRWRAAQGSSERGTADSCAGDANGDGLLEFAVGTDNRRGLRLLDRTGQVLWEEPAPNLMHLEMIDVNRDGRREIMHNGQTGGLAVRDAQGRLLRELRLGRPGSFTFAAFFSVTPWPTAASPEHVLRPSANSLQLLDVSGKQVAKFAAPKVGTFCQTIGTPVRLRAGVPPYFAVVASFLAADRSILYVYDEKQQLVYQEVLTEKAGALAARPRPKSQIESLLVGGNGRVLEYTTATGAK